jgi:outer membrane receptor for ferrienterochelin and colicin
MVAVAMVPGAAVAQNAASSAERGVIEEVVVTALRREQSLQEVPAAISVLGASEINAKAAEDYRDYLTTVPGVNLTEGNLGQTQVTIRGVSDGLGASRPLTGIYFDETPVTQSFVGTFDPNVFDIDRVEVLRGPQGTLYGAASMGGTVRIITNKPDLNTLEGTLQGRLGTVEHGDLNRIVNGVFNLPIACGKMAAGSMMPYAIRRTTTP